MTAKKFVKLHKPTAEAEKHKTGLNKTYWLIRENGKFMYFSSGDTEGQAWKAAKEKIIERLSEKG